MKKFKLIKKYPHSPELNTIITKIDTYWGYPDGQDSNRIVFLRKDKPEDYPEYWQEVVEKDYEILSFVNIKTTLLVELHKNSKYACKKGTGYEGKGVSNEEYCLNSKDLKIHSIKRLSDGEIFTIGDKIQLDEDNTTYGTITALYISHEQLRFYCGKLGGVLCHDIDKRNNFKKVKQPLFTTEDGVDVYEDSNVWSINKKTFQFCSKGHKGFYKGFIPNSNYLYFSTKEKAEEYIKLNSIRYSLKDIKEAFGESRTLSFKSIFNKLK